MVIPQEISKEMTPDFLKINDIVFLRIKRFEPGKMQGAETSTNLMVVILKGKNIFHLNSGSSELLPNDYIFFKRGEFINCEQVLNDQGEYEICMLFFDDTFIEVFLESHPYITNDILQHPSSDFKYCTGTTDRLFQEALNSMLLLFKRPINHQSDILQLKFNELLIYLLDSGESNSFHSFLKSTLDENNHAFSQFMHKNYDQPLNIEDFSQSLSMSSSTFNKRFKSIFQQPPKTWINEKRLERSVQLLSQPSISITEICAQTGFGNLSHFITLFKHKYGMTPKQFQKQRIFSSESLA